MFFRRSGNRMFKCAHLAFRGDQLIERSKRLFEDRSGLMKIGNLFEGTYTEAVFAADDSGFGVGLAGHDL